MDEGTKRWIDHEDMCPILTISSGSTPNPTPTSKPTSAPTAVPTATDTVSPTPDIIPPDNPEVKEAIIAITSVVEEAIRKILDLLEKLVRKLSQRFGMGVDFPEESAIYMTVVGII